MAILFTALATALSLLIVDIVVPGVNIANFPSALIAGLVIGLINGTAKPVLSTLSLPLNFLTFGAFALIVNGICFTLAASLTPGFSAHGLLAFILGPVVLSFANTFLLNYFSAKGIGPASTPELSAEANREPQKLSS